LIVDAGLVDFILNIFFWYKNFNKVLCD